MTALVSKVRMAAPTSTFEIRVLHSDTGDSWRDEGLVVIDGRDRLVTIGGFPTNGHWIGRRPEDVVGASSCLLPTDEPHDAFVARCDCGMEDCGALVAQIRRVGDRITWDQMRYSTVDRSGRYPIDAEPFEFDAAQYEDAIMQQVVPLTAWSPTTRQAAQLVNQRMKVADLAEHRLRRPRCGPRGDDEVEVTATLEDAGDRGRTRLSQRFTLNTGESAEALADRVTAYLTSGSLDR
ncbi:MAG: acyltransferase [Acidimicrobiales bacterium]|nr:acyltransferase [Acidimicrobiales bacterium]